MAFQFSANGKYFAHFTTDGKLKVWNTLSNTFEQEFTPDFHLTSPCTCLHFINSEPLNNKYVSPKKKKKRNSLANLDPNIALGTSSGLLLVYSISKADLDYTANSETSNPISCFSSSESGGLYSGAQQNVLIWDLEKRKLKSKWKAGNEIITAILALPDNNQLITASKSLKLWDIDAKEILRTFTGHSSDIICLQFITHNYFISGSKGDRLLNCWNLNDNNKNAVASFLMDDVVQLISVYTSNDGSASVLATTRNGVVLLYKQTLNGKCNKPLKARTTVQVVSDTGQSNDVIIPIRIFGAIFRDDNTLCIGHGTEISLSFESLTISENKKLQCLVRKDPHTLLAKQNQPSKTLPVISNDVHYEVAPASSQVQQPNKRKNDTQIEVPMEKRLENLTLASTGDKLPKANNLARLLIQGLRSNDKMILKTVLYKKNEDVIKNTVKRLPIDVLVILVQELTKLMQGKTFLSHVGFLWLKHILQIHAGILMSNPELPDLLGWTLGSIESRLKLLTPLNRLKGRLDLLLSQISGSSTTESTENEEAVLVYNDRDFSESEEDIQADLRSESENEWEEESSEEEQNVNHVESDSESVMSE